MKKNNTKKIEKEELLQMIDKANQQLQSLSTALKEYKKELKKQTPNMCKCNKNTDIPEFGEAGVSMKEYGG